MFKTILIIIVITISFPICLYSANLDNGECRIESEIFIANTKHIGFRKEIMQDCLNIAKKAFVEKDYKIMGIFISITGTLEMCDERRFGNIVAEYSKRAIEEIEKEFNK